jgi:hypothetical protein
MERQVDEIATDEIGGSPKRLLLPSAWLAFYSCTLLLGSLYLVGRRWLRNYRWEAITIRWTEAADRPLPD